MAFGRTDPDDPGSWQQKPPKRTDVEPKEPAAQPDAPERKTSPPVQAAEAVDVNYVANLARENLPKEAEFQDFIAWSTESLSQITSQLLEASGVNGREFGSAMTEWLTAMNESEKKLNEKTVAQPQPDPGSDWPPMPGLKRDALCSSIFDANDLALRGRKSVLTKRYHLPLIFPQLYLAPGQRWALGQKLEYRQEWRHEGFTLGELISSLSLLPAEELTLEVSSWQKTKTEISEESQSERREKLEREQSRTDEESCVNEAAASNGWTVSASGSVSYGPASASLSASETGSTSERSEQTTRHITEATSRAANEVSLKRAVKMTQTQESGSESRTTRRIKNPNTCHTVTFNFFQIVKLYDVQLRLDNDAPCIMLPGIFPAYYADGKPVVIPYWTIEGFSSPAVFLTQFFEVDRDLSNEIHGFALRVRMEAGRNPASALAQLGQALIVAARYLLRVDPVQVVPKLAQFLQNFVASAIALRASSAKGYGVGKGRSEQVTTPGIYADSILGRCTACESYVEASRYVDVMKQYAENKLTEAEADRRRKLLDAGKLEPFEPKA